MKMYRYANEEIIRDEHTKKALFDPVLIPYRKDAGLFLILRGYDISKRQVWPVYRAVFRWVSSEEISALEIATGPETGYMVMFALKWPFIKIIYRERVEIRSPHG